MTETWRTAVHRRSRGGRWRWPGQLRPCGPHGDHAHSLLALGGDLQTSIQRGRTGSPVCASPPHAGATSVRSTPQGSQHPREAAPASRCPAPCRACVVAPTRGGEDHHADASMLPIPVYHQDASESALPGLGEYYAAIAPCRHRKDGYRKSVFSNPRPQTRVGHQEEIEED